MHERVYAILRANPALLNAGHNALARSLGVSARGLRRSLQSEGQTLLMIGDELRMERARQLLTHSELSIKEIAETLGYSEASAFHRAFRRWTGESPLRYKRLHAGAVRS
jgi:AraC-like DNA-binding protein